MQCWQIFAAAACLVCLPVFVQAPLVRLWPWFSLCSTLPLVWLSLRLKRHPMQSLWGDLLLGFSWTWLAGSIYWGWLRSEPLVHLPVEAIGLPFAIVDLYRGQNRLGNWFYLGSLFGTAMTDLYFYWVNLIPYWRQVMQVEPSLALSVLHDAVKLVQTPWGLGSAAVLLGVLLTVGLWPLRSSNQLSAWAFSGAVLSTIVVDGLFWLGAVLA
ncbi:MAG: DUF3120 domain-containing protein [Pegethrix bostrychoides GSE-TBD4-15B]|jgi:hypothetical protein|uniref:DUF3120 domain-containing protein n=1 Tax=Pegethrix bostrychoides GSE-TBD4-15B TaxID=2839662 RepID=A0A951P826_9CYAN|nr:DUF3120 domain-containing protein [Pegethrix bostrychoides GSE-TBD4-15B]